MLATNFFVRYLAAAAVLFVSSTAWAYPPSPYHLVYGIVRDEYGTPLANDDVQVIMATSNNIQNAVYLQPGLAIGVNYQLAVPMDTKVKPDLYRPTALTVGAGFKMYVVVGSTTNVPIVSLTISTNLGEPTKMTQIDLFLGTDSNNDGIPDEFELAYLDVIGSSLTLGNLNPNLVLGHDGRTIMQEYLRGPSAFDNSDPAPVPIQILSYNGGAAILSFPSSTSLTYSVLGSTNLQTWSVLQFKLPSEGPSALIRTNYAATVDQILQVAVVPSNPAPRARFFRLAIQ